MGMESINSGSESVHPLRQELNSIESPLAKLVAGRAQDRSLERIDSAFNAIGEGFNIFNLVQDSTVAKEIFEELKALTDIDNPQEAKALAKKICSKIDNL